MRRIKELDIIVYEVYDLKGDALDRAVDDFIEECVMMSEEDTAYSLPRETLIEAIDDNEYFYDQFGNVLPINVGVDSENEGLAYLSLSEGSLALVNLERI